MTRIYWWRLVGFFALAIVFAAVTGPLELWRRAALTVLIGVLYPKMFEFHEHAWRAVPTYDGGAVVRVRRCAECERQEYSFMHGRWRRFSDVTEQKPAHEVSDA